jgi:hypothetical protein
MVKIKTGRNAAHGVKIPVSVPVEVKTPVIRYSVLDVVQFQKNSADGLVVDEATYQKMLVETDLQAKIDAGLVVAEEEVVVDPEV